MVWFRRHRPTFQRFMLQGAVPSTIAIRDASGAYFYAIPVGAISMAVSAPCCRLIREPGTRY